MNPQTRHKIRTDLVATGRTPRKDLTRLRARLSEMAQTEPPPDYARYIRSKAWRQKREEILAFFGRQCALCGRESDLQVHHLHYQSIGREAMEDVSVCCKRCHFKLHLPRNADPDWAGSRAVLPKKRKDRESSRKK